MESAHELLTSEEANGWYNIPLGETLSPLSRNFSASSETIAGSSHSEEMECSPASTSIFDPDASRTTSNNHTRKPRRQDESVGNSGEASSSQVFSTIPEKFIGDPGVLTRSKASKSSQVLSDNTNIDAKKKRSAKAKKIKSKKTIKCTIGTQVNAKMLGPAKKKAQATTEEFKENQAPKVPTKKRAAKKTPSTNQECQTEQLAIPLLEPSSDFSDATIVSNEQMADFPVDDSMYDIPSLSEEPPFQSSPREAVSTHQMTAVNETVSNHEMVQSNEVQATTESDPMSSSSSVAPNPGFLIKIPPSEPGQRAMSVLLPSDMFEDGKTVGIKVINGEITLISKSHSSRNHTRNGSMRKKVETKGSRAKRGERPPTRRNKNWCDSSPDEVRNHNCSCGSCGSSTATSQSDSSCHCESDESSDENSNCCYHQNAHTHRRRHKY